MMNEAYLGIAILFTVSLVVRIIPSLISISLSNKFKEILPIAVFINLMVYCFMSEFMISPIESLCVFALLVIVYVFLPKVGILLPVVLSSLIYYYWT